MRIFLKTFFLCLLFLPQARVTAAPRPEWPYRVLYTPHFEIIFHEPQRELAKRYALAAEQAYEAVFPIFKEGPEVIPIFINDDTDASNGMASFLPYAMITVNPVLPSTLDSIDDYGDWPFEMIAHEYTHILNMYPAHGIYAPFKYIFGSVLRPNAVLPKWYLEGLAVNLESRLSDHGRLRAPETLADARALDLGERLHLEDIAKINEQDIGTWPYGNRPYAFGGWWWYQVEQEHGPEIIGTWNQNFSRRIPFLLNGPMREQTNRTAVELLAHTADTLKAEADRELTVLRGAGPHAATPLAVSEKGEQRVFAVSPSGDNLLYLVNRPHLPGSPVMGTEMKLKIRTFPAQPFKDIQGKRVMKAVGTTRVRWIGDSQIVFDQVDIRDPYTKYRDLFLYDFEKKELKRLTTGQRAEQPSPSPKGGMIAFIKNDGGRNHLALLLTESGKSQILVHSNLQQRLSGPEFISDNEIVFAIRQRSGQEKLYVYTLSDRKVKIWNQTLASAQNPRMTIKGLLVSDDKTRVRNIYLLTSADAPPKAVTNTLTHVEVADYDPQRNEVIFSELTPDGDRLMSIPFNTAFKPAALETPKIDEPPAPQTKKVKITEGDYQPLRYMAPHYWIPFVYPVENGLLFQGATANSDPAGRNAYDLQASFDTVTRKPAYAVDYLNSSLPLHIGADYSKIVTYLGTQLNRTVDSQGGGLTFSDPSWPFNSSFLKWSAGGSFSDTTSATAQYHRIGPRAGLRYDRFQSPVNTWGGFMAELSHQEFLPETNYVAYGRTYAHSAVTFPVFGESKIFAQARAAFSPKMPSQDILDLGDRSLGANYMVNLTGSDFLLRGYPSGQFVGRKVLNGNFEFSLPAWELDKGAGTFPLFLQSLELAFFADAMSVDGAGYRTDKNHYFQSSLNRFFMGTGAELRLAATGGYHLPFSFTLGAYYGLNQQFGGGFIPFLGVGYGELGALSSSKSP